MVNDIKREGKVFGRKGYPTQCRKRQRYLIGARKEDQKGTTQNASDLL